MDRGCQHVYPHWVCCTPECLTQAALGVSTGHLLQSCSTSDEQCACTVCTLPRGLMQTDSTHHSHSHVHRWDLLSSSSVAGWRGVVTLTTCLVNHDSHSCNIMSVHINKSCYITAYASTIFALGQPVLPSQSMQADHDGRMRVCI